MTDDGRRKLTEDRRTRRVFGKRADYGLTEGNEDGSAEQGAAERRLMTEDRRRKSEPEVRVLCCGYIRATFET